MSADRARRLAIRVYPKAYRDARGEEIAGTLADVADAGGSTTAEVLSCWGHGLRLRLASVRPAVAAVVLVVVALAVGAGVDLSRPPAYRSDSLVLVGGHAAPLGVSAMLHDPTVLRVAGAIVGTTLAGCAADRAHPSLPTSTTGGRELVIACTARSRASASSSANALVAAYNRVQVLALERERATRANGLSRWIRHESARLAGTSRVERRALSVAIVRGTVWRARDRRLLAGVELDGVQASGTTAVLDPSDGSVLATVDGLAVLGYATRSTELPRLRAGDLLLATAAGLAGAIVTAAWLRRRPVPPWLS